MGSGAFLPDVGELPTIGTERLVLRAITGADVSGLLAIFGDPEVCRYWSHAPLADLAAALRLQQHIAESFASRSLFQWAITERTTGAMVGTCTLASLSSEHRRAEVGFALARAAWGHGYMRETLPVLLAYGFGTLVLHRIEADVDPRNAASIALLERVGFQREGHLRERYHVAGEVQDALMYGLLRSEWEQRDRDRISTRNR